MGNALDNSHKSDSDAKTFDEINPVLLLKLAVICVNRLSAVILETGVSKLIVTITVDGTQAN